MFFKIANRKLCDFVDDLLGFGGGDSGSNFRGTSANIIQGVDPQQLQNNYYQTQGALSQQQNFVNQLAAQGGIGNLGQLYGQQQNLANQYQNIANGTGPNPALAQLNNTTGQNIQNQAAMMAGQRGAGANVGLLARQAAMQGGNLQQQAAGQGAALQAQQQLNALSGLQAQQQAMGNQALNQAALQFQGQNQVAGNNANVYAGMQSDINNFNNTNVANQSNLNNVNSGIAQGVQKGQNDLFGGALKGAAMAFAYGGGEVPHYADGGMTLNLPAPMAPSLGVGLPQQSAMPSFNLGNQSTAFGDGPKSFAGQYFSDSAPAAKAPVAVQTPVQTNMQNAMQNEQGLYGGADAFSSMLGGKIKGAFSSPSATPAMAQGGPVNAEQLAVLKEKVPGKAKMKGNHLANDTVPAMLSPGEVVIPRSVMNSSDPVKNAALFVQQVMARKGKSK